MPAAVSTGDDKIADVSRSIARVRLPSAAVGGENSGKFLSGVLGSDGYLYLVPANAPSVLQVKHQHPTGGSSQPACCLAATRIRPEAPPSNCCCLADCSPRHVQQLSTDSLPPSVLSRQVEALAGSSELPSNAPAGRVSRSTLPSSGGRPSLADPRASSELAVVDLGADGIEGSFKVRRQPSRPLNKLHMPVALTRGEPICAC